MHVESLPSPYENSGVVVEPAAGMPMSARSKRNTQHTSRTRKRGRGWIAYTLVFVALAGIGYLALGKIRSAQVEVDGLKAQLAVAQTRTTSAEKDAMAATAGLTRSEQELAKSAASLEFAKEEAASKEAAQAELQGKLSALLEEGQGQVLKGADGRLTLQLVDKVLFKSGEAELTKRGERVMARVGLALKEMQDKQVWVQGHTDDVPVQKNSELFATNWELSAARALTVVHFLEDTSKVDPRRLAAAAFGSHRPVSRRKKSKNRRIEIVLFPREVTLKR